MKFRSFLLFFCFGLDFLFLLKFASCIMGIGTLRKQKFAHPWAIIRISPLQSDKHTEEANFHPSLGDRSSKPPQLC
jgi:hypothetical protein